MKSYCNICQMDVEQVNFFGKMVCPYHQHTHQTDDGETVFMYDEFNQDGEEW